MNDDITRRLREAAEAHQPDRARILARVERGAAGPPVRHRTPTFARSWPKAALAGLAAAGILATGGLAVAGIARTPPSEPVTTPAVPPPAVASSPPVATPPGVADPTRAPTADPPTAAPPTNAPPASRPTPTASTRPQNGPLWSEGSVDAHSTVYWAQSDLLLTSAQPLTSLTVELRVAQTGDVRDTGNWRTLPAEDFSVTVQESDGVLVYRWTLRPGRTVPAGQHEFAGQYNHAAGTRSAANDSYRVEARSAGGPASVWGGFAR
ncbi:hypothetical protein [Kitasatospora sp. NPDC005748]|uniref:hypothetical protein n=1 Tax=Kitasatospora sp. NPDC005748 TaxID=3157063 RepID=UPI0033C5125C